MTDDNTTDQSTDSQTSDHDCVDEDDVVSFDEYQTDGQDDDVENDARRTTIEAATEPRDPLAGDFKLGDPVIDLVTGRSMVVVDKLADRVDEYDGFDLLDHYAAQRTRVRPGDPVIGCIYTASLQSEPSGPRHGDPPYAFASSRLGRPTIESVDGYDRVYNLVASDVLEAVFDSMRRYEALDESDVDAIAKHIGGVDPDVVDQARELASVEAEFAKEAAGDD